MKNRETELIKRIFHKIIYGDDKNMISALIHQGGIDWQSLIDLTSYHEITPMIYLSLKPYWELLPGPTKDIMHNSYWGSLRNNLIREKEYIAIHGAFEKEGLDIVPIKGVALNFDIYKDAPFRPMIDIDVLIRRKDYRKASDVLAGIGYRKELEGLREEYWLNRQCHIVFGKKEGGPYPVRLEVHHALDFRRNGKYVLPDVWERVRSVESNKSAIKILSPEDTLFSIALHQRRFGKIFCLKYVLDAVLVMERYKANLDWDYILGSCRTHRLSSCLYFLILQARILLERGSLCREIDKLRICKAKKGMMKNFINANIENADLNKMIKANYLKAHFLLYDSFMEPVWYILNIPIEQFAKYYNLNPYSKKARFLYRFRLFPLLLSLSSKKI